MTTTTMTERERFIATLKFEPVDRVPFIPGHGRESTRKRWRKEGLPADVDDYIGYIRRLIGMEPEPQRKKTSPGMVLTMIPEFEEKIIEERPNSRVVQDWKGNVCEIGKEFDPSYLRGAPDFVTRSWIKCPVENRHDWEDMKRRYDANDPKRFPADFLKRCAKLKTRDYTVGLVFPGPFWQLREWLGFENLCMLLLDDPDFAWDMVDFWREFVSKMLTRLYAHCVPDFVMFNEDMAYKEKPMVGPDMARQFLLPSWYEWTQISNAAGVPIISVDSDGYVGSLIPVWIEAGIRHCSPMEVAAGNDLPALREQFGRKMAFSGGVDKRLMAKGGQAIVNEINRLKPVIDSGGYIPSCDHGVPSDVSWPDFVRYSRLLAEATGWL